jgi:hypothetical protein
VVAQAAAGDRVALAVDGQDARERAGLLVVARGDAPGEAARELDRAGPRRESELAADLDVLPCPLYRQVLGAVEESSAAVCPDPP